MIHAADSPFYETPKTFNRVCVNVPHDIHLCSVVDSVMSESMLFQSVIAGKIISKNRAFRQNVFFHHASQSICVHGRRGSCYHSAFAFNNSDNRGFLFVTSTWPSPVAFALSTHVCFIHFNAMAAFAAKGEAFGHQRANLFEHAPCGFIRDSGFPLNLLCRDTATGRSHLEHCMEPSTQSRSAFLKDRSGQRVNVVAAIVASVSSAPRDAMVFAIHAAFIAKSYSVRPALLFDELKANVIGRKFAVKVLNRVSQVLWDVLFRLGHDIKSMSNLLLVVKG